MSISPRRSSLSVLTNKFETIIEESRMARRSSLASPSGKVGQSRLPRTTNRQSSLADRLSMFESKIAENAQYSSGMGRSLHSATSSPVKKHGKKVTSLDEIPTPTSVSTLTETTGFSSYPTGSVQSTKEQSFPFHLCVPFHDNDGQSSNHSSLGAVEYPTMTDLGTEVPAVMEASVEKSPVSLDTETDQTYQGDNSHSEDDESDRSEVLESARMLLDWDYQQLAIRQRAAKERKATIDTGSRLSLKDRMKAFS